MTRLGGSRDTMSRLSPCTNLISGSLCGMQRKDGTDSRTRRTESVYDRAEAKTIPHFSAGTPSPERARRQATYQSEVDSGCAGALYLSLTVAT